MAEGPVLGRLPHISLPKCVQSGQTPIRRCAPLVARVDSTWCRARRIAVRSVASSESTARTNFREVDDALLIVKEGNRAGEVLRPFFGAEGVLRRAAN